MANTNTTPQDRIRIFDHNGTPLAEFRASVERSWAIGGEGRALFNYASRKSDIVNETVLQFGNWILIENTALPAWVGVIDTPRYWNGRQVAVHAYTAEHVFGWRVGPAEEVLTGSAGTIFENLISKLNAQEATVIQSGNIWRGGTQRQETINPNKLSENLKRLYERSNEEYRFRPVINTNGQLVVFADWVASLGTQTTALLLEGAGGGNMEAVDNILVEDEEITNDISGYGDGLTWTSKPTASVRDLASIGKYGLRQGSMEYPGVANIQPIITNISDLLKNKKQPVRTFHIFAINKGDTFKYISLGNVLKLRLVDAGFIAGGRGFESSVRIMGMAYNPNVKNKIELVVREVV